MIDQTLQMNYRVMDALGISGTPAIFLDGILYRGRTAKADLESAIEAVRTVGVMDSVDVKGIINQHDQQRRLHGQVPSLSMQVYVRLESLGKPTFY